MNKFFYFLIILFSLISCSESSQNLELESEWEGPKPPKNGCYSTSYSIDKDYHEDICVNDMMRIKRELKKDNLQSQEIFKNKVLLKCSGNPHYLYGSDNESHFVFGPKGGKRYVETEREEMQSIHLRTASFFILNFFKDEFIKNSPREDEGNLVGTIEWVRIKLQTSKNKITGKTHHFPTIWSKKSFNYPEENYLACDLPVCEKYKITFGRDCAGCGSRYEGELERENLIISGSYDFIDTSIWRNLQTVTKSFHCSLTEKSIEEEFANESEMMLYQLENKFKDIREQNEQMRLRNKIRDEKVEDKSKV